MNAPSTSPRSGRSSILTRHIAGLAAVSAALLAGGCATLPRATLVAETAVVTSRHGSGSFDFDGATNRYYADSDVLKFVCRSREEAQEIGGGLAKDAGASLLLTSGTNSMEPLIHGRAYVVVEYQTYDTITRGDLLVYMGRPNARKTERKCMLHRAVMEDHGGWLMCGDNNRWSESWDRVTPASYIGTVTAILEFPQG